MRDAVGHEHGIHFFMEANGGSSRLTSMGTAGSLTRSLTTKRAPRMESLHPSNVLGQATGPSALPRDRRRLPAVRGQRASARPGHQPHDARAMARAQEEIEAAEAEWHHREELLGWTRPAWAPRASIVSDWFSAEDTVYDEYEARHRRGRNQSGLDGSVERLRRHSIPATANRGPLHRRMTA